MSSAVMSRRTSYVNANVNLEYWMSELHPTLKNVPIIYLAIPGSHDSMTYSITRQSQIAPDAPSGLSRWYPIFGGTVLRWTRTQDVDITQQLLLGIRYFDLRIATKQGTELLYFTHGLYAEEISGPLFQIKEFLRSHPDEIVILDFQHFYAVSPSDHTRLIKSLINFYGPLICPWLNNLEAITLSSMRECKYQLIIVYRHDAAKPWPMFWKKESVPTPWPAKETTAGLIEYLTGLTRQPNSGFVHQSVCTPTTSFIVLRWLSSVRQQCAVPVRNEVFPVLRQLTPGRPQSSRDRTAPVNIVIADFIEMNQGEFPKLVIGLNDKLLRGDNTFQALTQVDSTSKNSSDN